MTDELSHRAQLRPLFKHGCCVGVRVSYARGQRTFAGRVGNGRCIRPPAPAIIEPGKCNTTLRMFAVVAVIEIQNCQTIKKPTMENTSSQQNEKGHNANMVLAVSGQTKFTPEEVIDAIKTLWIKEYGNLNGNENERDGYFVCGFVHEALKAACASGAVAKGVSVGLNKCTCDSDMERWRCQKECDRTH